MGRPEKFSKDQHFDIFKEYYTRDRMSIEDIANKLDSNSCTVRKYLILWNLYDLNRSLHRNGEKAGWNKLRKSIMCENCGWNGPCDRAHITPRKKGGSYRSENILILCPNCHRLFDLGRLDLTHLLQFSSAGQEAPNKRVRE